MLGTVQIPDQLANDFGLCQETLPRQLLEAFLLQRYAEGKISAPQVGRALEMGFHATERFLHDHAAPPNVSPEEQRRDVSALERLLAP